MTEGRGERDPGTPDVTIDDPGDAIAGVAGGGSGERATGTPNTIYDLSSVLFHALQGGASYNNYIEDAEREGDEELTEFFRRVREEDRDRAAEARLLLAQRTPPVAGAEDTVTGVDETEGSELDVSPGTKLSDSLPDTEPRAGGVPSGDARREDIVTEIPDEGLIPPEEAVPLNAPGPPESSSRAEGEQPPRTESISVPPGPGDDPQRTTGEAAPPRPEPSSDFPGTEPVRQDASKERVGEVPPPEEVSPERAGEIPMAEEVPPPRAEEVPPDTPSQAPPMDVQREASKLSRPEEAEGRTDNPAEEAGVTAEEMSPLTNVPRVLQSTVPLPDEDLDAEMRGAPPDAPAGGEDAATPAEAPREEPSPGEERPERRGL